MKISGRILDKEDLSPLPGANLNVMDAGKVTSFGTNSDEDGYFTLDSESIQPNTTFRISYIGYKDQVYSASELQNKTISLAETTTTLPDLVINVDNSKKPATTFDKIKDHVKKNKKPYFALTTVAIIGASVYLLKKHS